MNEGKEKEFNDTHEESKKSSKLFSGSSSVRSKLSGLKMPIIETL